MGVNPPSAREWWVHTHPTFLTQIKAHPSNPSHPHHETQREANMDIELAKQTLLARRAELTAH
ncbi:hypothetical protein, partial [Lentibacter algarum]|uniref:hypothetical protein n=1 Tax=Lentibacter algarum TaxID=576131 RepID=UPI0035C7CAC3